VFRAGLRRVAQAGGSASKRGQAWWGHVGRECSRGNEYVARVGEEHGKWKWKVESDPNPWKTRFH